MTHTLRSLVEDTSDTRAQRLDYANHAFKLADLRSGKRDTLGAYDRGVSECSRALVRSFQSLGFISQITPTGVRSEKNLPDVSPNRVWAKIAKELPFGLSKVSIFPESIYGVCDVPTGKRWLPEFYHPRGNVFDYDPTGDLVSSAKSAMLRKIEELRPHQKDDLSGFRLLEWQTVCSLTVTLSVHSKGGTATDMSISLAQQPKMQIDAGIRTRLM